MNPHAAYLKRLWKKDPEKFFARYEELDMSQQVRDLLENHTEDFIVNCNGVGSYVGVSGFVMNLLPDFVRDWMLDRLLGMDGTPASDLHDNEFTVPHVFANRVNAEAHKDDANTMFRANLEILINRSQMFDSLDDLRRKKADLYYTLLSVASDNSFYDNKVILAEVSDPEDYS